jgi:hypothetical protein
MLCGSGIAGTNYTTSSLNAALGGGSYSDTSATPTDALAQYRIDTTSDLEQYKEGSGAWTTIGTWNTDGATDTLFDVRWNGTGDTGALAAGSDSLNTWLNMSGTRLWGVEDTGSAGGPLSITGTIEIRDAATLVVLASATLTLTAEEAI